MKISKIIAMMLVGALAVSAFAQDKMEKGGKMEGKKMDSKMEGKKMDSKMEGHKGSMMKKHGKMKGHAMMKKHGKMKGHAMMKHEMKKGGKSK
ncbi:MAG: hypothetical protein JSS72_04830 [Armatimonadetes bacterium]|nr:hypothetical protein [Armatimonadota bacterium]